MEPAKNSPVLNQHGSLTTYFPNIGKLAETLSKIQDETKVRIFFKNTSFDDFLTTFFNLTFSYNKIDEKSWNKCIERINRIFQQQTQEQKSRLIYMQELTGATFLADRIKSKDSTFTNCSLLSNMNPVLNFEVTYQQIDPLLIAEVFSMYCHLQILQMLLMNEILSIKNLESLYMTLQGDIIIDESYEITHKTAYIGYYVPNTQIATAKKWLNHKCIKWGKNDRRDFFFPEIKHISLNENLKTQKKFIELKTKAPREIQKYFIKVIAALQHQYVLSSDSKDNAQNADYTEGHLTSCLTHLNKFATDPWINEFVAWAKYKNFMPCLAPHFYYIYDKLPINFYGNSINGVVHSKGNASTERLYYDTKLNENEKAIYEALNGFFILQTYWERDNRTTQKNAFNTALQELRRIISNNPELAVLDKDNIFFGNEPKPIRAFPDGKPRIPYDEALFTLTNSNTEKKSSNQSQETLGLPGAPQIPQPHSQPSKKSQTRNVSTNSDANIPIESKAQTKADSDTDINTPREKKRSLMGRGVKKLHKAKQIFKATKQIITNDDIAFAQNYFALKNPATFIQPTGIPQGSNLIELIPGEKPFFCGWDKTIGRWHKHKFGEPLNRDIFPEYADYTPDKQLMHHLQHNPNSLVNRFLEIGMKDFWTNEKTNETFPCRKILGKMNINGQDFFGTFEYTYDPETLICFHNWFRKYELLEPTTKETFDKVLQILKSPSADHITHEPLTPFYIPRYHSTYSTDKYGTILIKDHSEIKKLSIELYDHRKILADAQGNTNKISLEDLLN